MNYRNTKDLSVYNISYLIYGDSKTGKTSLASTVDSNRCLLINTENNLSSLYGKSITVADAYCCDDMDNIINEITLMENKPEWVILDSISDFAMKVLLEENSKTTNGMQAFYSMEKIMYQFLDRLKQIKGINLVCLASLDKIRDTQTGMEKFSAGMPSANVAKVLPYAFDVHIATKIMQHEEKPHYLLQCEGDNQYSCGIRKPEGKGLTVQQYEPQDLLALHNKILT